MSFILVAAQGNGVGTAYPSTANPQVFNLTLPITSTSTASPFVFSIPSQLPGLNITYQGNASAPITASALFSPSSTLNAQSTIFGVVGSSQYLVVAADGTFSWSATETTSYSFQPAAATTSTSSSSTSTTLTTSSIPSSTTSSSSSSSGLSSTVIALIVIAVIVFIVLMILVIYYVMNKNKANRQRLLAESEIVPSSSQVKLNPPIVRSRPGNEF